MFRQVPLRTMIIPQIAENETKSGTLTLPEVCPCCGGLLYIHRTEGGTRQLFCENENCVSRLVKKFVHFCDKTRMDIPGLSDKTLENIRNELSKKVRLHGMAEELWRPVHSGRSQG